MSGLHLVTPCCVLVVKSSASLFLSHSRLRLECQNAICALDVTECESRARGAVVCVGVVVPYSSENPFKWWTLKVRAFLGSEVMLSN